MALLDLRQSLRRAGSDDRPASGTALGAHVDDPVGALDHVEIVLDYDGRIALVDESVQDQ